MAHYRYGRKRTPQTPEQLRLSAIIMFVIAAVMFVSAFYLRSNYKKLVNECTAFEMGSVTDVATRVKHRHRGRSITEYKAHIELIEGSALGRSSISSDWTVHRFLNGETVKIYYDPNDTSTYYVNGATPDNGTGWFTVASVLSVMGVFYYIKAKKI